MSNIISIKKGLDVQIAGKAAPEIEKVSTDLCAVKPTDFHGLVPKMTVKVGDTVKAGSTLFYDKYNESVCYSSPISGEVVAINRGERRRILNVVIKSDNQNQFEKFEVSDLSSTSVKETLLKSGLWPAIKMRPYGIVARPEDSPRDIFISAFNTAPLAADLNFILKDSAELFQKGIEILSALTEGDVHLGVPSTGSVVKEVKGAKVTKYSGPHPAGNVGIQIANLKPINKGDVVWTVAAQDVVAMGKLFTTGEYDATRVVALAGSEVAKPKYYQTVAGAKVSSFVKGKLSSDNSRVISGDILTGTNIGEDGFLGYYDSLVSVIPEGNYYEMFGWGTPGFKKFSPSRTFFTWLCSKSSKKYKLDTNIHGEERAFVMSGEYERVLPMDIFPVFLLKSILVNDIDKMEQLGIYEVIEEDLALCEYVCTSKIDVQKVLRQGLETMIKELG